MNGQKPYHWSRWLLVSLGALGVFVGLALCVYPGGESNEGQRHNPLTDFDDELNNKLRQLKDNTPGGVKVFNEITDLGDRRWLTIMSVVVALFLVGVSLLLLIVRKCSVSTLWQTVLMATVWMVVVTFGGLLDRKLKNKIQRPRPPTYAQMKETTERPHPTSEQIKPSWSFPSGHSMGSLVVYGMLAYLVVPLLPRRWARVALTGGLGLLVLLIGFSRIYLGWHYPSDVVGGFAAGAWWLGMWICCIEIVREWYAGRGRSGVEVLVSVEGADPASALSADNSFSPARPFDPPHPG